MLLRKKIMEQETIMHAAAIEEEAQGLEENLQLVMTQIAELENFKESLEFLGKSREKEILSSLGKRVYMKSKIEDREKLFVEVGAGVVVRKTPEDTIGIVKEQILRLQEARVQISAMLEIYQKELENFMNAMKRE